MRSRRVLASTSCSTDVQADHDRDERAVELTRVSRDRYRRAFNAKRTVEHSYLSFFADLFA